MIVVIPKPITDSMISSNTAPASSDTDYPGLTTWAAGTYADGDYVFYSPNNSIYQSNADSNTTVPPTGAAEVPPKWTFIAKDNKYRLFDGIISNPTIAEDGFSLNVTPGAVILDSLAGFNIEGVNAVVITESDTGYSRTIEMQDNSAVIDWWTYYFSPIEYKTSFVIYDLPATLDAVIGIDFQTTSTASVGEIVIGNRYTLGTAVHGSGFQNADLSRVDYDDFGNVTGKIIRPNIDIIDFDVRVETDDIGRLRRIIKKIGKTTECVWSGSTSEMDNLLCYGFYEEFSVLINYPTVSDCSIKVRTAV